MIQSVIAELRHTPFGEIGQASYRSKALLLVCSTLAVWVLAERFIFDPRRAWILAQAQQLSQWHQRIEAVQSEAQQQAAVAREYQSIRNTRINTQPSDPLETSLATWLEWATLGLQTHDLDGDLSQQRQTHFDALPLDHKRFRINASGPWASLLHWWDALMTMSSPIGLFVHDMIIRRGKDPHRLAITATVSVWRAPTHDSDVVMRPMVAPVTGAFEPLPFGLGHDHPMIWRQRPLDQFRLVGVAMTAEQRWAWLMDPVGQMHSLGLGDTLAENRYRLERILPDHVIWLNLESGQRINWVVP